MKYAVLMAAAAAAVLAAPASAVVLTFDDVPEGEIADGYGGFDWDNFHVIDGPANFPESGYENGIVSGTKVAFNAYAAPALVLSSVNAFTLNSGYFTGAWNNGITITVEGYGNAGAFYQHFVIANAWGPTFVTFNWTGLNSVRFSSAGGVDAGMGYSSAHFALDNLALNEGSAVPEPASWAMMIAGFGAAGAALRRGNRRTRIAFA